jgi:hypothetical protein
MRLFHFRTTQASKARIAISGRDKNSDLAKAIRVRARINLAFGHEANSVKPKYRRGLIQ